MGLWICQTGTLVAVQEKGLRPHGDNDGVIGVARFMEYDGGATWWER